MQVAKVTTALGTSVEDGLGIVAMVALEGAPGIWCVIDAEKSISVKSKQQQERRSLQLICLTFYLLNSAVFLMGMVQKVFFLHWSSRTNFKILLKVCKYVDVNDVNLILFFKLNFLKLFACKIKPKVNVKTTSC